MKKALLFITIISSACALSTTVQAQNIGINTANPDASAILDISHTTRGLLIPRVQLVASNNPAPVAAPVLSLLVFNLLPAGASPNDVKTGYYYWDGSKWVSISTGSAWGLLGNAGTTAGTNFVGTTDNQDLVFKTNAIENMRILNINGNVGIGTVAPVAKLEVGNGSIGDAILGVVGGGYAGKFVNVNNGYGNAKLLWVSSINQNAAGYHLYVEGNNNPELVVQGNGNVGIGIAVPGAKLHVIDNANRRTLHVEHDFNGLTNTDAAFIGGIDAGFTATGLFVLQKDAVSFSSAGSNLLNVVKNSVSQMVVNGLGNVGIGNSAPTEKLEVNGSVKITDGTQGAGKIFVSDALGKGSWQSPSVVDRFEFRLVDGGGGGIVGFKLDRQTNTLLIRYTAGSSTPWTTMSVPPIPAYANLGFEVHGNSAFVNIHFFDKDNGTTKSYVISMPLAAQTTPVWTLWPVSGTF